MVNLPLETGEGNIVSIRQDVCVLDQRLVIAAIGEAGEGKSTLLNLILNSPGDSEVFFDVSDEPEACTVSPSFRY